MEAMDNTSATDMTQYFNMTSLPTTTMPLRHTRQVSMRRLCHGNPSLLCVVPDEMLPMVHEHWSQFSAPSATWHHVLGVTYVILGTLAITGNSSVIYIFTRAKSLHTPANTLVVNLAISDLVMSLTQFPFFVTNSFSQRFVLGATACKIYGFCGALSGCASIISMALIALDRYCVIVRPFSTLRLTKKRAVVWVILAWVYSFGWTILPFFGWNAYVPEGFLTSCTFDYLSESWTSRSYILVLCFFLYVMPLVVIIGCYGAIVKSVMTHEKYLKQQATKMKVDKLQSNQGTSNKQREIQLAKIFSYVTGLWVMAWTPYAAVSLWGLFGDRHFLTPHLATLPAVFAKTAAVYNPLVYAISHPRYREAFRRCWRSLCGQNRRAFKDRSSVRTFAETSFQSSVNSYAMTAVDGQPRTSNAFSTMSYY